MELSPNNHPKKSDGGVLKTTTWGTLIALTLALAITGFSGHFFGPKGNGVPQTAIEIASAQGSESSEVAQSGATVGSPSRAEDLNAFSSKGQRDLTLASKASSSAAGTKVFPGSNYSGSKGGAGSNQATESGTPSAEDKDPEALIAANGEVAAIRASMALVASGSAGAPSAVENLMPLYSGGLCDAVKLIAPSAPACSTS